MAIDTVSPRSRRAVLAAALGGVGALVAQALGRPLPARGANGQAITVGGSFTGTSTTRLENTTATLSALELRSDVGLWVVGRGMGIHGAATDVNRPGWGTAIRGTTANTEGRGVYGVASSSTGATYGVHGQSASSSGRGVYGVAASATGFTYGVYGRSSSPSGYGVYGYNSAASGFGNGVWGQTASSRGAGVFGRASSSSGDSSGVWGDASSPDGHGVHGKAFYGTGGYFESTHGTALHAQGRVQFSTSGLATIGAGSKSVTVTPGVEIDANTKILATLQQNAGAGVTVERVYRDAAANKFNIVLTANASSAVKVGWFVIG